MSDAVDRVRARKMRDELERVLGDEATAKAVGSGVSTGVNAITELWAKQEADKTAKAKAATDKANQDAATAARQAAEIAKIEAMSEKDPAGDLHTKAAQLDAKARLLEQKAGVLSVNTGLATQGGMPQAKPSSTVFTPTNIAIGVGVLVAGFVGYKLFTHNSSAPRGFARRRA